MNAKSSATARKWLDENPLFLDTETTGLGTNDEIVQIAIVDRYGVPVINTLVRPSRPIQRTATAIHGLTDADVRDAPTSRQVMDQIYPLLAGRLVVAYNADFDLRFLRQTAAICGGHVPRFRHACAMKLHAEYAGVWDEHQLGYRWWKLEEAALRAGLGPFAAHDALADAQMTGKLVEYMASH